MEIWPVTEMKWHGTYSWLRKQKSSEENFQPQHKNKKTKTGKDVVHQFLMHREIPGAAAATLRSKGNNRGHRSQYSNDSEEKDQQGLHAWQHHWATSLAFAWPTQASHYLIQRKPYLFELVLLKFLFQATKHCSPKRTHTRTVSLSRKTVLCLVPEVGSINIPLISFSLLLIQSLSSPICSVPKVLALSSHICFLLYIQAHEWHLWK